MLIVGTPIAPSNVDGKLVRISVSLALGCTRLLSPRMIFV